MRMNRIAHKGEIWKQTLLGNSSYVCPIKKTGAGIRRLRKLPVRALAKAPDPSAALLSKVYGCWDGSSEHLWVWAPACKYMVILGVFLQLPVDRGIVLLAPVGFSSSCIVPVGLHEFRVSLSFFIPVCQILLLWAHGLHSQTRSLMQTHSLNTISTSVLWGFSDSQVYLCLEFSFLSFSHC